MKEDALYRSAVKWILSLLDRFHVWNRWPMVFGSIQVKMAALYGARAAAGQTRVFVSKTVLHIFLIWIGFAAVSPLLGSVMLQTGLIFGLLIPWYSVRKLGSQVVERQRRIILELPELLNKLTLLLNAGETIHQAVHRCVSAQADLARNPLQAEWRKLSLALKDNKPFMFAVEDFSRSCGVLEVSMFSTAMLLNFRRGGNELVAALQELSHTLWERRKALAKTLGEEASSKLVFPTVLLFCTVMVIVAAPAVLMMN